MFLLLFACWPAVEKTQRAAVLTTASSTTGLQQKAAGRFIAICLACVCAQPTDNWYQKYGGSKFNNDEDSRIPQEKRDSKESKIFWCSWDTAYPFKEAQRGSFPKGGQNPSIRYLFGVHRSDVLRKL